MPETPAYRRVAAEEVEAMLERGEEIFILDLREPAAFGDGHIPEAISLPADHFGDRYSREIVLDDTVLLVCERGLTSEAAARFLTDQGFTGVMTLVGGMSQWTGPRHSRR